ncbi:MAG: hypothetical protein RIC95_06975 [Vicingaceae bacterium]
MKAHLQRLCLTFFIFLSIFLSKPLQAQTPASFPSDSIAFFESMESFLVSSRKEGKDFMKQFEEVWYGGYFSEQQREGVYAITNRMLKKKLRAFPDFRNYLFTVGSFVVDENQTDESFMAWQRILVRLLEQRRKKNFTDFLEFCNDLFRENAIYYSPSVTWASNNNDYVFGFDSLPKITFQSLDLICYSKRDSMKIYKTKGAYYPTEKKWIGQGGIVSWQKSGLLGEEVFAELDKYVVEAQSYDFTADSVIFHNSFYLSEPLLGKLENKLLANMTPEKTSYPRFDSYDKRISIQNIMPGVNFDGGFSMRGAKLLGKGDQSQDAIVEFQRGDTLFLRVMSENFSIRTDRIISTEAAIRFYLGKDSISHPGLNFKYLKGDQLVTLYKEGKGVSKTPYENSFHQIEMNFEVLNWKTNEPLMTFTNLVGGTKTDAFFTSADFFKEELFDKIGGRARTNPLYSINAMVNKYDSRTLNVTELGYFLNIDKTAAQNLIVHFSTLGFLTFDFEKDLFTVKQKLIDYVLANNKKIDYDVISIYSDIDGSPNGKINLLNNDLTINGIPGIVVSDSQQVVILPSGGQIKMKRNRYFTFAGRVKAGLFDFYGKDFAFDYQNFKVNLNAVDSMQVKALTGEEDELGNPKYKPVKTVIQGINGDLLIDNFENKSGLKDFPEYPIINSRDESYVFYDKKEVLNGVYKKDNFYFKLEPFTIDSIDNFSNDKLDFEGTFSSANIFPDFDEHLTLQEDFSLGFVRPTPTEGFPMYQGKGQFYNDIKLSHDGLRGDGKLDYITSTTYSKDFIFFPDSMTTLADKYFVEKQKDGVEYPPIKAEKTKMRWLPKQDVMYATTTESGMEMYDPDANFEGTTAYRPDGVDGDGVYHFNRADLFSDIFEFKYITFDSDTADFQLKDPNAGGFALKTKNVNSHVDYKQRFAEFKANGKAEPIEFPINQYICFMEEFKWYMDDGSIALTSKSSKQVSADVKLEGSKFISTKPDQDSLFFYAPYAKYDSRRHIIDAEEVQYINTADARVYPDSGFVTIKKKAKMDPLLNSIIVANSVTEYHNIYNANTNIFGRKDYSSSGYIDYLDRTGSIQTLYLQSITVDTTGQTVGNGDIADSVDFTLSPEFLFDGKVKLFANNEFLVFDGLTKINHECQTLGRPWIRFESEINPNKIFIPVDTTMEDSAGARITSSINLNIDSTYLYSGFLVNRSNYSDINILPAYGFLHYDLTSKEFRISSKEKIDEISLPGNYLSLNTTDCKIYGEGLIDVGARTGNLSFNAAGNINHNLTDNSVVMDMIMTIDFFFDDNAIKKMADEINENINLNPVDFSRETYEKGLREIVGTEKADEIISQLSLNGKIKRLPDELNKRIVLSDVKFKWNEDLDAYKSFGPIGITNINKEEVNKYVNGAIMITKKRSGDIVDILLEMDDKNWYYFNYRRNLMKVISTNEDFNTQIKELKRDKRRYNNAKGEEPFTFMYGTEKDKRDFERDFESDF